MTVIMDYIEKCPMERRKQLQQLYTIIKHSAPTATETINYGMPTFRLNGNLVHFANAKHHIGFYPSPSAIQAFSGRLSPYHTSKGAIRFDTDQSLPVELITDIVKFRVAEQISI